jgi:transposase
MRAAPFGAQLRRAVARSQARGRVALVLLDNLGIHTPRGSLLLRALLEELRGQLVLVYTPAYDPDANRIEERPS